MTREDAYALGNIIHQEVITFYESQFNEIFKKCNIYPQYRSFRGNTNIRSKLINQIFDDHEAQVQAKDDEIIRLKKLVNDFNNTYSVGDFDFESYYAMLKDGK